MSKRTLSFILGMLSVISFIPIFESITEVICGKLEIIKGKHTKEVLVINKEIQDLQAELEPISTQCIGFRCDDESDEECEEECKVKIGFCK